MYLGPCISVQLKPGFANSDIVITVSFYSKLAFRDLLSLAHLLLFYAPVTTLMVCFLACARIVIRMCGMPAHV